jgi:molybdopterin/thiamine biosynthesis adenylyltransferase
MTMEGISNEEVALYDRQIRVWGIEAQKRYTSLDAMWLSRIVVD